MTRLSFPYFMSREVVDYIVQAVTMVAKQGWKLLHQVGTDRLGLKGKINGSFSSLVHDGPEKWFIFPQGCKTVRHVQSSE